MKYYSEVTRKLYDTEDELLDAESKVRTEEEKAAQLEAERKEAYKQVQKAYEEYKRLSQEYTDKYSSKRTYDAGDTYDQIAEFIDSVFGIHPNS